MLKGTSLRYPVYYEKRDSLIPKTPPPISIHTKFVFTYCFGDGPPWRTLVRVECSFLLVQRWKLILIKLQLQVTNFYYKYREEPSRNPCNHHHRVVQVKVRERSLGFYQLLFKIHSSIRTRCNSFLNHHHSALAFLWEDLYLVFNLQVKKHPHISKLGRLHSKISHRHLIHIYIYA